MTSTTIEGTPILPWDVRSPIELGERERIKQRIAQKRCIIRECGRPRCTKSVLCAACVKVWLFCPICETLVPRTHRAAAYCPACTQRHNAANYAKRQAQRSADEKAAARARQYNAGRAQQMVSDAYFDQFPVQQWLDDSVSLSEIARRTMRTHQAVCKYCRRRGWP